jgi:hypothetical protein
MNPFPIQAFRDVGVTTGSPQHSLQSDKACEHECVGGRRAGRFRDDPQRLSPSGNHTLTVDFDGGISITKKLTGLHR